MNKKKIKNDIIFFLSLAAMRGMSHLSLEGACDLGAFLGRLAYKLDKKDRKVALDNLAAALGDELPTQRIEETAMACFEHLGRSAGELLSLVSGKLDPLSAVIVEPIHRRNLENALSLGRGVVAITGHLGNWELMAVALASMGFPINTVAKKSYDSRFTAIIHEFRESRGVHCLYRGDPELPGKAGSVLASNQVLGLLIDQDTKVPGVFVEFFGKPAYTPVGAAVLARKYKSPMLGIFTHRNEQGLHEIEITPHILPSESGDALAAVQEDTQILTKLIEERIRMHPDQWVWMHERWKTKPKSTSA